MKRPAQISLCFFLLLNTTLWGQSTPAKKTKIFVMDFITPDRTKNDLTLKFTRDFENALVQFDCYTVLDRRNIDRVLSALDREKLLADALNLSKASLDNLKAEQVDLIVSGEVLDDVESGQFNVSVTFQAFDGTKVLIKSTLLSRGLVNDATSRQKAMESLVKDICARTTLIKRVEFNGFLFELRECTMSERSVTCRFLITNNGEDRALRIYNYSENDYRQNVSKMFDDFSAETLSKQVYLATKKGDERFVESLLISGRPAETVIVFEAVSSKATIITRLDLRCWEGERETYFTVKFRNIPIEK